MARGLDVPRHCHALRPYAGFVAGMLPYIRRRAVASTVRRSWGVTGKRSSCFMFLSHWHSRLISLASMLCLTGIRGISHWLPCPIPLASDGWLIFLRSDVWWEVMLAGTFPRHLGEWEPRSPAGMEVAAFGGDESHVLMPLPFASVVVELSLLFRVSLAYNCPCQRMAAVEGVLCHAAKGKRRIQARGHGVSFMFP